MSFRDGPRYIRMDYKLELVLIPVTDVDRAKKFYLDNMPAARPAPGSSSYLPVRMPPCSPGI